MIRSALMVSGCVALLALAVVCIAAASAITSYEIALRRTTEKLPDVLDAALARESDAIRSLIDARARSIEERLNEQLSATRADANEQLSALRLAASSEVAALRVSALEVLDKQLTETNASIRHVAEVRDDIQPALAEVNKLTPSLLANALGAIAASKVTAGAVAQSAREFNRATPELIRTIDRIANNSDRTTAATARAMNNVAEMTKPLPRWVRVPLQILAPSTPIVLSLSR